MLDMLKMSGGKGGRKLRAKRAGFHAGETPTKNLHLTEGNLSYLCTLYVHFRVLGHSEPATVDPWRT